MSGADFDWSDTDSIVVSEQLAVAVFKNPRGDVVIRQQDFYGDEDDWIVVAKTNVSALVRALMSVAGIEASQPTVTPLPKSSGAERSRRYRERRASQEQRDAGVTRDADGNGKMQLIRDAAE